MRREFFFVVASFFALSWHGASASSRAPALDDAHGGSNVKRSENEGGGGDTHRHLAAASSAILASPRSSSSSSSSSSSPVGRFAPGLFRVEAADGRLLWQSALPVDAKHQLAAATGTGWIIAFQRPQKQLCLRRFDNFGHGLWRRCVDEHRQPALILASPRGGFLVKLQFALTAPVFDYFAADDGSLLWQWKSRRHYFVDQKFAQDGSLILLGNRGRRDNGYWLTKVGKDGVTQWSRETLPTAPKQALWVTALSLLPSGDIVVKGQEIWHQAAAGTTGGSEQLSFAHRWTFDGQLQRKSPTTRDKNEAPPART